MRRVHVSEPARPSAASLEKAQVKDSHGGVLFPAAGPFRTPGQFPIVARTGDGTAPYEDRFTGKMPGPSDPELRGELPIRSAEDVVRGLPADLEPVKALTQLIREQASGNNPGMARATVGNHLVQLGLPGPIQRLIQQRFVRLLSSQAPSSNVLLQRGVPVVPMRKSEAWPEEIPEDFLKAFEALERSGQLDAAADLLLKAAGHKYLRRTGSPGSYRYTYGTTSSALSGKDAKLGDKFRMASQESGQDGHYEVVKDHGDGSVTIRHDETGASTKLSRAELHAHVMSEHKVAHTAAAAAAMSAWEKANKKGDHKMAAKHAEAASKHFARVEEAEAGLGGKKLSEHWQGVAAKHKNGGAAPVAKTSEQKEASPSETKPSTPSSSSPASSTTNTYTSKAAAAKKASVEATTSAGHAAAAAAHEEARAEASKFGGADAIIAKKHHDQQAQAHKKAIATANKASNAAITATQNAKDAKGHLAAAEAHAKAADAHGDGNIADLHKQHMANHVAQAKKFTETSEATPASSSSALEASKKAQASGKSADHKSAATAHQQAALDAKGKGNHELAASHDEMAQKHGQQGNAASVPELMDAAKAARKKATTENTSEAHAGAHKAISALVEAMKAAKDPAQPLKPGEKHPADSAAEQLQAIADQHFADAHYLKQHHPDTKPEEHAEMANASSQKPKVPASKSAMVAAHTSSTKYPKPDGKLKLQGHGEVDAVKASNLKPGTVVHFNQTDPRGQYVVTDVQASGKTHTITEKNLETGKTFTRKKQANSLVGVHKDHFQKKAG